ncbi:MAG: LacI family DNA-binding transcriptional regulator [Ferrimicrobium sp.]
MPDGALGTGRTGDIRPTIHDVARLAGVSTASVSRALSGRGHVSGAIRDRVRQAADELGYKPHIVARSLVERRTWLLGIIVPDISNPFFPDLVRAIQVRAERGGYGTLLSQVIGDTSFTHQLELLGAGRVDGIITVGLSVGQLNSSDLSGPMPSVPGSVVLVSLDRDSALPGSTLIAVDHASSARMAVGHLVTLGHRNILYIDGPSGLDLSVKRRLGYEGVMRAANGISDDRMIVQGDLSEASGYRAIGQALADGVAFSAVFAANDLMAIGAMSALRNAGFGVPEDVSVVGFDDITIAAYVSPGLTTIHQPADLMGTAAAEVAIADLERLYQGRTVGLPSGMPDDGMEGSMDGIGVEMPASTGSASEGASQPTSNESDQQTPSGQVTRAGSLPENVLRYALSKGLAHESWQNGRRVITFDAQIVVRNSTAAFNVGRWAAFGADSIEANRSTEVADVPVPRAASGESGPSRRQRPGQVGPVSGSSE